MEQTHTRGYACGAVRYRIAGKPNFLAVCHCKFCQRRFTSAFATLTAFDEEIEVGVGDDSE